MCVILYSVGGALLYSTVLYFGYRKSIKEFKRVHGLVKLFEEVIKEIRHAVTNKEEDTMSEERKVELVFTKEAGLRLEAQRVKNELTLTDLLTRKATDAEYAEIIDLLTELAKQTYEDFKFYIAKSHNEAEDPNFLQIASSFKENPSLHKLIFAKAVSYGIDMKELQERFAKHVALGNVIDLGEDTVVITNDNTAQLPTGVSPINSGLENGEIAFIISFIKKENYKAWHTNTFPVESGNE